MLAPMLMGHALAELLGEELLDKPACAGDLQPEIWQTRVRGERISDPSPPQRPRGPRPPRLYAEIEAGEGVRVPAGVRGIAGRPELLRPCFALTEETLRRRGGVAFYEIELLIQAGVVTAEVHLEPEGLEETTACLVENLDGMRLGRSVGAGEEGLVVRLAIQFEWR